MSKKATVLVHQQNEGSCLFGRILNEIGFHVQTVRANLADLDTIDPIEPDLLMVMGGPIGVYQADDYPFLHQEIDILKKRLARDLPTLGVCLGSQLMAKALGANVYRGPKGREAGWGEITITDEGMKTPIRHFSKEKTKIFQWHGDTFDFPEGAVLLATSEKYQNQAFGYGKNAIALQCHPEVTNDRMKEWYVGLVTEVTGASPLVPLKSLREDTARYVETANAQSRTFLLEWLEQVGLGSYQ